MHGFVGLFYKSQYNLDKGDTWTWLYLTSSGFGCGSPAHVSTMGGGWTVASSGSGLGTRSTKLGAHGPLVPSSPTSVDWGITSIWLIVVNLRNDQRMDLSD